MPPISRTKRAAPGHVPGPSSLPNNHEASHAGKKFQTRAPTDDDDEEDPDHFHASTLPSTTTRSPFVRRTGRVWGDTFIPNNHDKRPVYPGRAKRRRLKCPIGPDHQGGVFTAHEQEIILELCENYRQANKMTQSDFVNMVQSYTLEKRAFMRTLNEHLPYRQTKSISQFMQRNFHEFERGPWTREDDEKLAAAVQKHGTHWKAVSMEVNRFHEQCFDRYRNYHQKKNQRIGKWDDDETYKLRSAIGDDIRASLRNKVEATSAKRSAGGLVGMTITEAEASRMFLWPEVSKRVPQRGRLQCQQHFGHLRKQGTSCLRELQRAMRRFNDGSELRQTPIHFQEDAPDASAASIRLVRCEMRFSKKSKVKRMYGGDRLLLAQAVRASRVKRDEYIDWRAIKGASPELAVFASEMLRAEWLAMKAGWTAVHHAPLLNGKTRKTAKRLEIHLNETLSPAEKLQKYSGLHKRPYRMRKKRVIKSPELVDSQDELSEDEMYVEFRKPTPTGAR